MLARMYKTRRRWYQPAYIARSTADVDFDVLQREGIKAVFVDLDGTVVTRATYEVSPKITEVLSKQPLKIYIATNRPKSRDLKNLKELLHAQGVIHPHGLAGKPLPAYFKRACKDHGLLPSEVAMIGDRYIQDIIGANAAGLTTVIVYKLDKPAGHFDTFLSGIEHKLTERFARSYKETKS